MRVQTIRAKITLLTGAVSLFIVLCFSLFLFISLRNQLFFSIDENLRLLTGQLLSAVEIQSGTVRFNRNAEDLIRTGKDESAFLVSSEGKIFDQIILEPFPVLPVPNDPNVHFQTFRFQEIEDEGEGDQETYRFLISPIQVGGGLLAYLLVGQDVEEAQEAVTGLLRLLLLAGPVLVALASIGGYSIAGRALSSMEKVRMQADSIQVRDLSHRLDPPETEDEVGRLVKTFNTLLDRLEDNFRRQQRFTADASHELRTPLAIIQGTVDVALERPRSGGEYVEILHSIGPEVQRMNRLVNELLLLARADANELRLEIEKIDLADLLRLVVDTLQAQAEEAGVRFHVELPEEILILGDRDRLLELFLNLIENAIQHAPGSQVTVARETADEVVRIWVKDNGPGIPPEHLPHIFERFYQVDPARERRDRGSGLGLAIADEIARLHGGRISVQSSPGVETAFIVELSTHPEFLSE